MLNRFFQALGIGSRRGTVLSDQGSGRMQSYAALSELYMGRRSRVRPSDGSTAEVKVLRYNRAQIVANVGASWLGGLPIIFDVRGSQESTQRAATIWEASGADASFMGAALSGAIYGDACIKVVTDESGSTRLQWLSPCICYPEFDPHDVTQLTAMVIAYQTSIPSGGQVGYYEEWKNGTVTIEQDGGETVRASYSDLPFVWIRNWGIQDEPYGISDIACLTELVAEHDHLERKRSEIVDYYSAPNLVFIGVQRPSDTQSERKTNRTAYYVPEGCDVKLLEWHGNAPDVEVKIRAVKEEICTRSETPEIVFGQTQTGSDISGVALRVLYAPLMRKTERKRASWGPALEKAMQMALGGNVPLESISVVWPDPMPANDLESWQVAGLKRAAGVSEAVVLGEQGYTGAEIQAMQADKEKAAEAAASRQQRIFNAGGQAPE